MCLTSEALVLTQTDFRILLLIIIILLVHSEQGSYHPCNMKNGSLFGNSIESMKATKNTQTPAKMCLNYLIRYELEHHY